MRRLIYLFALVGLSACRALYPSMMLETNRNYKFTPLPDSVQSEEYKISPNDLINFRLYSNDGFRLVDFSNLDNTSVTNVTGGGTDYLVEQDGTVVFPVIGRTPLQGMTIREAYEMLEKKYSQYYIKPYVLLKVTNRRVIVFPGDPGSAKVVPLLNNNTTVIEALAQSGGLTESGKAWQIKLIRGDPANPKVYLIDLSTINGIKAGSMILQENDIIYVTPQRRVSEKLLERLTPALSLLSSLLLIYVLVVTYKL